MGAGRVSKTALPRDMDADALVDVLEASVGAPDDITWETNSRFRLFSSSSSSLPPLRVVGETTRRIYPSRCELLSYDRDCLASKFAYLPSKAVRLIGRSVFAKTATFYW